MKMTYQHQTQLEKFHNILKLQQELKKLGFASLLEGSGSGLVTLTIKKVR